MAVWPLATLGRSRNWERRVSSVPSGQSDEALLRRAHSTLTTMLRQNIVPFWTERLPAATSDRGVIFAEKRDGGRMLNLVLHARYLWFLAALCGSRHARELHFELAHRAYASMIEWLHDGQYGGFYWEIDLDTRKPSKPNKHLYGQAFAIYALTQFACATGNIDAANLATATFAIVDARAHDSRFGGYQEWLTREWQPAEGPGYLGRGRGVKTMNTHLHLLEAWTSLHAAAPEALPRERIVELMEIVGTRTVSRRFAVAFDGYQENWTPLRGRSNHTVSFGHEVQAIPLLLAACDAVDGERAALAEPLRRRFAYCMRFGFDYENGGFFSRGRSGRPAGNRTKIWWVQAEALLAALTMYAIGRERPYIAAFELTLSWIDRAQTDWTGGDWHREIDARGQPHGAKVDRWKCPYHNGRAVLECLRLIDELL
jgi:mannobiose 2-epimerase